jgi:opacity protein-like surface antigen
MTVSQRLQKRVLTATVLTMASAMAPSFADAQDPCKAPQGYVCLPQKDLDTFLTIARDRQCLEHEKPVFDVDRVVIVTDEDGRVFYTGADPKRPFTIRMKWCHLDVDATGEVQITAGMKTPETYGFRFRPKAYLSYLPFKLSHGSFESGVDAGILIDLAFFEWVNFNVAAGFRSVGAGLGFDLTTNFGIYAGYGIGWTEPLHNVNAGVYFAF